MDEDEILATDDLKKQDTAKDVHPVITWDDFDLGEVLGTGAFANVYQIKPRGQALFNHQHTKSGQRCSERSSSTEATDCLTDSEDSSGPLEDSREDDFSASADKSGEGRTTTRADSRYALKTPHITLPDDPTNHGKALHLLTEAKLLLDLPYHKNVISLHAISDLDNFENDPSKAFIVLDRLTETLDVRLKRWRDAPPASLSMRNLFRKKKEDPEQWDRITSIGLGIAQGLAFLHQHHILYRDLKVHNVGFDHNDQVRIFDFGLSRKLVEDSDKCKQRMLTPMVGTMRTMAPEVYKGLPYSYSADTWSFAMVFWEVITLERPWAQERLRNQMKDLIVSKIRPSLHPVSCPSMKKLLASSWDPEPEKRPYFATIVNILQNKKDQSRPLGLSPASPKTKKLLTA